MADPRALAARYGVAIAVDDLGDWGTATLVAEYDPAGPTIRVNRRALEGDASCTVRERLERAIAHELYHHREAIGEIPRLPTRGERERAADAFADALLRR